GRFRWTRSTSARPCRSAIPIAPCTTACTSTTAAFRVATSRRSATRRPRARSSDTSRSDSVCPSPPRTETRGTSRRAWLRRVARPVSPRRLRARLAARLTSLDRADLAAAPATLADVYYCYRLLLRRNPDPTGYRAYADKVADGITVEALVGYFLG